MSTPGLHSPAAAPSGEAGSATRATVSVGQAPKQKDHRPAGPAQDSDSVPCFGDSFPDCASTDPDVSFSLFSDGDTSGCTFEGDVDWGDGTEDVVDFDGGPDGSLGVTFTHTYDDWGVYPIAWSADVVSGSTCSSNSGTLEFTLGVPPTAAQQGAAPNPSQNPTTCSSDEPVNCATGTFWRQFTDFSVPGRGVGLDLSRTYSSSQAGTDGPFGFGWTFSYGMSLATAASGNVTVAQEDGSTVTFDPDGSGGFAAPPDVLAALTQNPDGSFTFMRDCGQIQYNFSAAGRLTSEADLNGYQTLLGYNAGGQLTTITDPAGRALTLTYSGAEVATVTDPMGREWTYSYDANGDLTGTTDPLGRTWSFTYGASHLLLTATDPRGGVLTNVYNASGQVTSQTDPAARTTTWSYSGDPASSAGSTTTMTDPNGDVTTYGYSDLELDSVTHAAGTALAATTSYSYDPATLGVTTVVDPNGNVTASTYDGDGNLLTSTDPLGNVTSYEYDSLNQVIEKTSPLAETTSYNYDADGNLLSVTDPLGNTTTYAYGDSAQPGDVTSITDPDGNVTSFTYDSDGDAASISVSPSSGVTDTRAFAYNPDGERTCEASPAATSASVKCPAAGKPPVADTTSTSYDSDGEVTAVTNPDGNVTSNAYDGDGNVTRQTDAAGNVTSYAYNGDNQVTKVTRPDGSTVVSTYDGDGNLLTQADAAGATTTYAYNALNELTSQQNPLRAETAYGYDADGNRTTVTDPAGRVTTSSYDGDNELTGVSYSDGVTPDVSLTYDPDGQRASMTDGTGTTSYSFDADGHLVSVTNGAGATASYGYDPAGLLTSIGYPNGQTVTRTYDGAGQLASVTDWLGNTTNFRYDADGNVTTEAYPNGVSADSAYDQADQLLSITDKTSSSTLASFAYTRNSLGDLKSATATGAVRGTADYTYTQLSQVASDGSGSYAYNPSGDLTAMPGGITQTFNAGGELTSASHPGTQEAPAPDQVVAANETAKGSKITSLAFTTKSASEIVLAFISAGGPAKGAQSITRVSGGGLTWKLVTRSDSRRGTVEVWQSRASAVLKAAKITATLKDTGYDGSITIATFTGSNSTVGAHAAASGASGAPAVSLTTKSADSLVWAVGEDPSHSKARTVAKGQTLVHQFLDTARNSTDWTQKTAAIPARGTVVKVADTAPKSDKWDMAAVEITAVAPSAQATTYGYDKDGDRTSVKPSGGPAVTLTYDQANRLTGYGTSATYAYNGDGLRMSKTVQGKTTQFSWDQSGRLPMLISAGPVSYIYGPGGQPIEQISGSTATYLQADGQDSTRLLTSGTGSIVGTYSYSSYGAVTSHTGSASTALGYDGQYTDAESGYLYLRARYYDPASGQFLTIDPAVVLSSAPYGYAAGNPLSLSDPSGYLCFAWSCIQASVLQPLAKAIGVAQTLADTLALGGAAVGIVTLPFPEISIPAWAVAVLGTEASEVLGNAYLVTECAADPGGGECANAMALYQETLGLGDGVPEGVETLDDLAKILGSKFSEWSMESEEDEDTTQPNCCP